MATHDDPAAAWDRYDKLAEELADNRYETQRDELVADAAAGDPGEADEERYLLPRAPMTVAAFDHSAAAVAEHVPLDNVGGETDDDSDDDEDSSAIIRVAPAEVIAFLEDLRDYLQAKPACDGDPEAEELVEHAQELIDRLT